MDEALAERADEVARESGTARSHIYARALEEFLIRSENQSLLQRINGAFADFPDEEEAATLTGIRPLQQRSLDSR